MKKLLNVVMVMMVLSVTAQTSDKEERIKRDVEVAENVLSTLIRQQMDKRSSFWGTEVKGTYTPGFGVTLRVPYENYSFSVATTSPAIWGDEIGVGQNGVTVISRDKMREEIEMSRADVERLKAKRTADRDSARNAYGDKLLTASKSFLADYGDLIGLEPNERIMITTKSERGGNFVYNWSGDVKSSKRKVISVEGLKSDMTQFKQGKITRDQLYAKFKIINSDISAESTPDLELLSTIIGRLYRPDLSKTYYSESTPYFERMKDFGVTYYMQVYSSTETSYKRWTMPTLDLLDVSQEERDKKVKELYPTFEKDLKENILEYGRTLNSLKDDELLIFDVKLTKCVSCGIPSTLEVSVKASVLKEYGSGKLSKDAAVSKFNVKKGTPQ